MAQNPQKVQSRNLQKFYSFYVFVAMIICAGAFLVLAASLFSIIRIEIEVALVFTFAILVLFAPVSFYLKSKNQNRSLRAPSYTSEKVLKFIRNTTFVLFILAFAFGILAYSYAPIRPYGSTFIDKIGNVHSSNEFVFFKKWEFTFVMLWSIVALQTFIALPVFNGQTRKWWQL